MNLPDMMGDEVLRRLKENPSTRDIPVVMLSADATPAVIESLLSSGATDYLTKPLDVKNLLGVIGQLLGRKN
jgi:hypothetical protein